MEDAERLEARSPPRECTVSNHNPGKRKRNKNKGTKGTTLTTTTIKSPPWTYINISLTSSSSLPLRTQLDELTVRGYITTALTQYMGLTGSAIAVDILEIGKGEREGECWIRVPRKQGAVFAAAVGGWIGSKEGNGIEQEIVGWRVRGTGGWLGTVIGQSEVERLWNN